VRQALSRSRHPLWLVGVRLRHRWRVALLGALGIAAAAATLAVVLGGSLVAQDRRVAHELAEVPPGERSVQVAFFGVLGRRDLGALDSAARAALRRTARAQPVRVVQYKTLRIGDTVVQLRAIDGVRRWVRLNSGRYPRTCRPSRCEVVRTTNSGRVSSAPGVHLVEVGRGRLISELPFGRFSGGEQATTGEEGAPEGGPPSFVAEGVAGLGELPALSSLNRSFGWVVPLEGRELHPWAIRTFTQRLDRAKSDLESVDGGFELTAPTTTLLDAAASGRVAARRLLLIGGQTVALLLAFTLLAAATRRRDLGAFQQRLARSGARRWQVMLSLTTEAAAIVLTGLAIGWLVGLALVAAVGRAAGTPAGALIGHSILSPWGLVAAGALALAAVAAFLLAVHRPALSLRDRSISSLDIAALGALAVVGLGLARGRADADVLAGDEGAAVLLLLLPGLITFVAVVAVTHLLRPAFRLLERSSRSRSAVVRAGALSLVRDPGHATGAVAFLLVSVALSVFALLYRGTLEQGLVDQARYAVPADLVVQENTGPDGLVAPLQAAPLERYGALADGLSVLPVERRRGTVTHFTGERRNYVILGVPSASLGRVDGWRSDFSGTRRAALAEKLTPRRSVELRGSRLPADARAVELPARIEGGLLRLRLHVLTTRGDFAQIDLGTADSDRVGARVPAPARGGRLVGLELTRALGVESHAQGNAPLVIGNLTLGPLTVRTGRGRQRVDVDYRDWIGAGRVDVAAQRNHARLHYIVGNDVYSLFRPRQPFENRPLPVVVSPGLAAIAGAGGRLPLPVGAGFLVTRVVGTADRFPSTSGDFILADGASLFAAVNGIRPGLIVPDELWLSAPSDLAVARAENALGRPPFSRLAVVSQASTLERLRSDPLTRGTLLAFGIAAPLAFLLAVVGFLVLLLSDLRDDRGELFRLETQGAGPASLRRHVLTRAFLVAGAGLLAGFLTGLLLGALVVETVIVAANGTAPEPPLLLELEPLELAGVVVAYVALTGALALVVCWNAFRSDYPARATVLEP
jgi:hypothetical protein